MYSIKSIQGQSCPRASLLAERSFKRLICVIDFCLITVCKTLWSSLYPELNKSEGSSTSNKVLPLPLTHQLSVPSKFSPVKSLCYRSTAQICRSKFTEVDLNAKKKKVHLLYFPVDQRIVAVTDKTQIQCNYSRTDSFISS